jgi:hypothetical protein
MPRPRFAPASTGFCLPPVNALPMTFPRFWLILYCWFEPMSATSPRRTIMKFSAFMAIFMILLLLWAGGFLVYHVASALIHLLLLFAVIALVIHLLGFARKR